MWCWSRILTGRFAGDVEEEAQTGPIRSNTSRLFSNVGFILINQLPTANVHSIFMHSSPLSVGVWILDTLPEIRHKPGQPMAVRIPLSCI